MSSAFYEAIRISQKYGTWEAVSMAQMMEALEEAEDHTQELVQSLKEMVRYAEAARISAGMGKTQVERLERAKALLVKADGETET